LNQIILASSSPFRRELLSRLHLEFESISPDINESRLEAESPSELVQRLAREKAQAIAGTQKNSIVIGSDQVASFDNQILGKPGNLEKAIDQLKMVSGKQVTFHTGLCVIDVKSDLTQTEEVKFFVEFRKLTEEKILRYLEKEPAFNCAGSFKSEGLGVALTNRMYGDDATALIGLPLIRLTQMLEHVGVEVP